MVVANHPTQYSTSDTEQASYLIAKGCQAIGIEAISPFKSLILLECPNGYLQWLWEFENREGDAKLPRLMFRAHKDLLSSIKEAKNNYS